MVALLLCFEQLVLASTCTFFLSRTDSGSDARRFGGTNEKAQRHSATESPGVTPPLKGQDRGKGGQMDAKFFRDTGSLRNEREDKGGRGVRRRCHACSSQDECFATPWAS